MRATTTLLDILEDVDLRIDDYLIDAKTTVLVIQHGSQEFEVEEIEISHIEVFSHGNGRIGVFKLEELDNDLQDKLTQAVELLALEKARNTSEELWDYQLLD